jgi:predicted ATPase/DNA-binding NarL/FixJ family response regulator
MRSGGPPGRLRGELTEFVGRRAELAAVRRALYSTRLVTLTGPGGIGKTRLATQAASGARRAYRDGVWLVELGGLRDPALLAPEVARSLGLLDQSARWGAATLSGYLAGRHVLLVLDQCEHLADACAVLADALLRTCPQLHIIATSRHVLGVVGESTVAVPPMTVPAGGSPPTPNDLLRYEAVRLFADRAAAVLPGFALDLENAPAVAEMCRRLDGIPLAIELAAVRLRALSPGQILSRLSSRFQLLSSAGPARGPRHQTLQATLDWSYELLTEAERVMWHRVSVFAGSFDLDAASAVCAGGGIAAEAVVDLIDGLVAKSILLRGAGRGQARYRLLDTIGEFGRQKLRGEDDERGMRVRHRGWYAALAARQEAFGPRRAEWIASLDTDHENLRAALEFSLSEPQELAAGVELACDLWRYWDTHGHLTEGRRILAAALENLDDTDAVRPRALWVAGHLAMVQGDLSGARTLLEAGLSAATSAGDVRAVGYASTFLGNVLYSLGEVGQAHALVETALRLHRDSADQVGATLSLLHSGYMHLCSGQSQAAAERFGECMRVSERGGNLWSQTYARWGLGVAALLLADPDGAAALEYTALRAAQDIDDRIGVAQCLEALAWIAAARKQSARALTLFGAAEAARAAIPAVLPAALREHHEAALGAVRAALPGTAYAAAFASGGAMSPAAGVAFALGEPAAPPPRSPTRHRDASASQLTPREEEVAVLVARGLSNSQIAGTLVISARTVETHVLHIMDKLGFSTRAQIAAWSAARPQ